MNDKVLELLADLSRSSFRDVAGSRASVRMPVARSLVNTVVARWLQGGSLPVKSVDVQPHDGDKVTAIVAVSWPLVPVLKIDITIERQPQFPESPILVLHWSLLGGIGAVASRFVSGLARLPPGIRLEGQFIVLDIPVLVAGSPAAAALPYIRNLQIHSIESRLVLEVDLEVASPA